MCGGWCDRCRRVVRGEKGMRRGSIHILRVAAREVCRTVLIGGGERWNWQTTRRGIGGGAGGLCISMGDGLERFEQMETGTRRRDSRQRRRGENGVRGICPSRRKFRLRTNGGGVGVMRRGHALEWRHDGGQSDVMPTSGERGRRGTTRRVLRLRGRGITIKTSECRRVVERAIFIKELFAIRPHGFVDRSGMLRERFRNG